MSNWSSELVTALMDKCAPSGDDQVLLGTVVSLSPISVKMFDKVVSKYVYADPVYTVFSLNQVELALQEAVELPNALKQVIRTLCDKQLLKIGDTVIVLRRDVSFYILAKVG